MTVDVRREKRSTGECPSWFIRRRAQPRSTRSASAYGTDTGARLSLGTELRRLNRRGHRFNGDMRLSGNPNHGRRRVSDSGEERRDRHAELSRLPRHARDRRSRDRPGLARHELERRLARFRAPALSRRASGALDGKRAELTETVLYPGMQLTLAKRADAESLFTRKGYSWSIGHSRRLGKLRLFDELPASARHGRHRACRSPSASLLVSLGIRRDQCRRFVALAAVAALLRGR